MNKIIIVIIIALVFFSLGFISANYYKSYTNNTFEDGWEAAKQRLEETSFVSIPIIEGTEITSVSGEVKEVKNDKIYVEIDPLEPLADLELDNRVIETDSNTKIYQLVQKDQEQLQREMDEFQEKIKQQIDKSEPIMPPELYIKQEISLSDIKAGQQIIVIAEEDIKDKKEFKAIEITVQFELVFAPMGDLTAPVTPAPVTPAPVTPAPVTPAPVIPVE